MGVIKGSVCHDVKNRCKGASGVAESQAGRLLRSPRLDSGLRHFPFPVAAITNYLSGLKQTNFTLFLFWRLEVRNQFH